MAPVRELIQKDASTAAIAEALGKTRAHELQTLLKTLRGEACGVGTRAKVIAGLWASKSTRGVLETLMTKHPDYTCAATLKRSLQLLDAPRKMRQLEHKLSRPCKAVCRRRLHEELSTLQAEGAPDNFSATRSFCKAVTKRLSAMPADRLEFDLLFFKDGPWKDLMDLAHVAPSSWALPFFQSAVFGAEPPEGSLLADARGLTPENLVTMIDRHPRLATEGYSFIRQKISMGALAPEAKLALVRACPLFDIIWHYEELRCPGTDDVVDERLSRMDEGEALTGHYIAKMSFAPMAERLLAFRRLGVSFWPRLMPVAEQLLDDLKSRRTALLSTAGVRTLQSLAAEAALGESDVAVVIPEPVALSLPVEPSLRVAVLGDASASMQTAINSACICGAMMTAVFEADLVFFNNKAFRSRTHPMPSTAEQVLQVTEEVRANSSTSPAAALGEFYEAQKKIDLFIVVSDEGENTAYRLRKVEQSPQQPGPYANWAPSSGGLRFAPLFKKYQEEVHAEAKCVFISFLREGDHGTMLREMEREGLNPKQYRCDVSRPDLAKFDGLLASILLDAQQQLEQLAQRTELTDVADGTEVADNDNDDGRSEAASEVASEWSVVTAVQ